MTKTATKTQRRKARKGNLTVAMEERMRPKLRGNDSSGLWTPGPVSACSEPWVDAQFVCIDDTGPDGELIQRRFHDPHVFPPRNPGQPATSTKMGFCAACLRYHPAVNFVLLPEKRDKRPAHFRWLDADRVCDDCAVGPDSDTIREMHDADVHRPRGRGSVKVERNF